MNDEDAKTKEAIVVKAMNAIASCGAEFIKLTDIRDADEGILVTRILASYHPVFWINEVELSLRQHRSGARSIVEGRR